MTAALVTVDGDHVVAGMTIVDAAGEHEILDVVDYPGRFVGPNLERAHIAHFVDGGCCTLRGCATYLCRTEAA